MNSNEFEKDDKVLSRPEDGEDASRDTEEPSNFHRESEVENAGPEPSMTAQPGNNEAYNFAENDQDGSSGPLEPYRFAGLYAGFWTRFWAYLLDLIVIGSINRMILNPIFRALDVPLIEDGIFSPMAVATAVVFYLYFVLMTKFLGQTLGKMVFGLKVVELDGKRLTWGTVIFREWIGRFISATVLVLYIVVAFTKKKQGLHDIFADTTVIYEPR